VASKSNGLFCKLRPSLKKIKKLNLERIHARGTAEPFSLSSYISSLYDDSLYSNIYSQQHYTYSPYTNNTANSSYYAPTSYTVPDSSSYSAMGIPKAFYNDTDYYSQTYQPYDQPFDNNYYNQQYQQQYITTPQKAAKKASSRSKMIMINIIWIAASCLFGTWISNLIAKYFIFILILAVIAFFCYVGFMKGYTGKTFRQVIQDIKNNIKNGIKTWFTAFKNILKPH